MFYCPAGHRQYYAGKTEEEKLRRKLAQTQSDLKAEQGRVAILKEQRDKVKRSHMRMRERVKNGVCPCCTRSFDNLARHMKTKHPEFGKKETLRALRDSFGLSQTALAKEIGLQSNQGQLISRYETGKPVSGWYRERIENWIVEQSA